MTVRVNKQPFNIREKLSELERPIGVKGNELMRAETAQDARDLVSAGRKNLIINGAMEVVSTSNKFDGRTDAATVLTVDRFHHHGSGGTYNTSQQTVTNGGMLGLPIKFKNYLKFDVTTGANNCGVWQTIEDVRTVQGLHTYSFYARGTNPSSGKYELDFRQYFGSGGSSTTELTFDVTLSSEWKRYTFTFTPESLSGKTIGANSYCRIFLRQPDADNTTNAYGFQITGLQLEVGGNATEFEHRSYGEELALCQRYYQNSFHQSFGKYPGNTDNDNGMIQTCWSDGNSPFGMFPTPMRAQPTVTLRQRGTNNTGKVEVGGAQKLLQPNKLPIKELVI